MNEILFQYQPVSPGTWVYLSSLLMIGLFFKFSRFWSVRNLDLLMLILLAPGLLMVHFGQLGQLNTNEQTPTGQGDKVGSGDSGDANDTGDADAADNGDNTDTPAAETNTDVEPKAEASAGPPGLAPPPTQSQRTEYWGYVWLLTVNLVWLLRMLLDTGLTRRPLLTPNLSVGGMAFIGVALFAFLAGHSIFQSSIVDAVPGTVSDVVTARMEQFLRFQSPDKGPGNAALDALPIGANRTIALLSHFAIVFGLVMVSWRHFGNATNGIGAATLYLMIPYTSQMTGRIDHCLPAALLIWAIFFYRRPLLAGLFIGAAIGCIYYPLFMVPLWLSFYWRRGWIRFLVGALVALALMTLALRLTTGSGSFLEDLQRMFGVIRPAMEGLEGVWNTRAGGWSAVYRLPVLCAVLVLGLSMILWPAQKNLATLISCSAAMMLCSQFWHGYGGGLYIAWYLPLALLMIFRPNLEDRVAQSVVKTTRRKQPVLTPAATGKAS